MHSPDIFIQSRHFLAEVKTYLLKQVVRHIYIPLNFDQAFPEKYFRVSSIMSVTKDEMVIIEPGGSGLFLLEKTTDGSFTSIPLKF